MKTWIMAAIIIGILVIAGIVVSMTGLTIADEEEQVENIDCKSCGNSCTVERNCGLASCGARTGGSCGCRG